MSDRISDDPEAVQVLYNAPGQYIWLYHRTPRAGEATDAAVPQPTMIERVRKTIMDAHALLLREGNRDKIGVVFINHADDAQFRKEINAINGELDWPPMSSGGSLCYFDGCKIQMASDHVVAPGTVAWLRASCMSPPDPQPGNFLPAAEEAVKRMTKEVDEFLNEPKIDPSVFDAINTIAGVDPQPKDCTCPTSVLLVSGCKCGGK